MICGGLGQLVITATLLGHPSLQVRQQLQSNEHRVCESLEPRNPNAVIALKDSRGHVLLSSKIHATVFDAYDIGPEHGGVPSVQTVVMYDYPVTLETAGASSVEVQMLDRDFRQSAALKIAARGLK